LPGRNVAAHHIDLPVGLAEPDHRDVVRVGEVPDRPPEPGADLLHDRRRRNRAAQVPGLERGHLSGHLQIRDVPVEVDPVHALDVQPDMTFEQIVDGHHSHPPA